MNPCYHSSSASKKVFQSVVRRGSHRSIGSGVGLRHYPSSSSSYRHFGSLSTMPSPTLMMFNNNSTAERTFTSSAFSTRNDHDMPIMIGTGQGRCFSSTSTTNDSNGDKKTKEPSKEEEEEATTNADAASAADDENNGTATEETPIVSKEEELQQQINELETKLKTMQDQLLRSYAEQENIRNIAKKDVVQAQQYAIKNFAKSMLEVVDNLQRALESVQPPTPLNSTSNSTLNSNTNNLETLYQGIQMTFQGLEKALASHGVTSFEAHGQVFDPTTMNALMEYEDSTKEPGTVGQVIKSGYMLKDRILRPAEVGVIKKNNNTK